MTDRMSPDGDEPASGLDQTGTDLDQSTSDSDQSEHPPATKPTRMRPSALQLERAFD
jgi:hypothetical protein